MSMRINNDYYPVRRSKALLMGLLNERRDNIVCVGCLLYPYRDPPRCPSHHAPESATSSAFDANH